MKTTYLLLSAILLLAACSSTPDAAYNVPTFEVEITNLGSGVNTEADDFAPTITANGVRLYFSSNRSQTSDYDEYQDFYVTQNVRGFWGSPERLVSGINTDRAEGTSSIGADGQTIYFASAREGSKGSDIYSAVLEGKEWGRPVNLGSAVNSAEWDSHPSVSPDGNTLFFSSDRDGGMGGLDIWKTERRDDGSWGKATNLGPPINTDADEVSPFIAADNMTLYFSSDGHPGLEGTDLYVTRLIRGQWQAPQNMGYPLNSAANDEFLTLAADGKTIYFASRRDGGEGGLDLYKAYPNPYPPQPVTVLSGKILEFGTREPLSMPIVIRDAETGTILRKQQSNAYTGEYILVLASGKTYSISTGEIPYLPDSLQLDLRVQERYDEQSYNFMLHREQPMQQLAVSVSANVLRSDFSLLEGAETVGGLTITEVQAGETIPLLNYVFFDHGSAQIPQRYVQLTKYTVVDYSIAALPDGALGKYHHVLNILGQRLQQQPELAVRLTGAVSEDEMQLGDLAGRRVQAVSQYLMDVWGIEAGRIEVTADGLPQNPSGSETPQGQAENRRVEILYRDGDNLEPINTTSMTRILKPAQCVFYPSIMSNAGVREWELAVAKEGSIQRIWRGQDSYPDSIVWNWQDAEGNVPRNESPLSFTLSATDIDGYSQTSQEHTIPVQFDSYTNTGSTSAGFVVDTFHLILFDFDQADVSRMNRQILDQVSERVTQQSRILIRGYSDEIGTAEYNRELAERRAEAVRQVLRVRHPNTPVVTEALGESELLYDNALPEGRFYCRTVRVIVETRR